MAGEIQAGGDGRMNPKAIARNSVILFVRMAVITLINLYSVRLVLTGLGDMDYAVTLTSLTNWRNGS